ncbi:DUF2911 domain-containing protein [Crocinitomix catalasitica]|uniref:DUF2911 domain-containing protein n=1 Tax=Crocinitomix catalasitica TaxID=184607 RepID=UPI00047F785C|nr:DUF2911 domain-containing protein [Crocinitomix catalasitica]
MKKLVLLVAAGLMLGTSYGQTLPSPSPLAKITQSVGVSELALEYSRPSVKGRTIFGELVPYDQVWRLGANACTKFTSSTDVKIGGKNLPAGTYSVFATPSNNGEWTIAFNSDIEQGGTGNYDTKKDVASVKVKATTNSFNETLVIEFNTLTNNSGVISIQWEKVRVDVPFTLATDQFAKANIDAAIKKGENLEDVYYNAANYFYQSLKNNKSAMTHVEKSLSLKPSFRAYFLKARLLQEEGKTAEAIELGDKAHKMAVEEKSMGYASFIESTVKGWK